MSSSPSDSASQPTPGGRASKVYTRTGDKGKTSLVGGTRVSKSELRLETYGTVDELNSVIGVLIHDLERDFARFDDLDPTYDLGQSQAGSDPTRAPNARLGHDLVSELREIQRDLFDVGSQLACEDAAFRQALPMVSDDEISALERRMDLYSQSLKPLKNFILPGGARSAAQAHVARTVCRRTERLCVRLNEELAAATPHAESADESTDSDGALAELDPRLIRFLNRLSDYFFVLSRLINATLKIDEPLWEPKMSKKKTEGSTP